MQIQRINIIRNLTENCIIGRNRLIQLDDLVKRFLIPIHLPKAQLAALKKIVIAAYKATNCRDYARMDIRLRGNTFYILDVNHNADLSPDTSIVLGAGLMGLSYGMLGSYLVNLASRRHTSIKSSIKILKKGEKRCREL